MSDRAEMERLVNEALKELGLPQQVFSIEDVRDQAHVWCINFSDGSRLKGGQIFEITLAWDLDSTYESVKEDLKQKLRAETGKK